MNVNRVVLAVLAAALSLAGCKSESSKPASGGGGDAQGASAAQNGAAAVVLGNASDLRLSPDGKWAAFLMDGKKPRGEGVPPQLILGELQVAPLQPGAKPRKVGESVVNTPGAYLFSADSRWLFVLQGFNPASQAGELLAVNVSDAAAAPRSLGRAVSYVVPSPDSQWVAFVDDGTLRVAKLGSEEPVADLVGDAASAAFAPAGDYVLAHQRAQAGGALVHIPLSDSSKRTKLGEQVGDFQISPDGRFVAFSVRSKENRGTFDLMHTTIGGLKTKRLAVGVTSGNPYEGAPFAFSSDGKRLARFEGARVDKRGDLFVGPASGEAGKKVASNVYRFQFAPDGSAVAYLDEWADNKGRGAGHGFMGVATLPDGAPKKLGERVPNFEWAADGKHLAYVIRVFQPIYSVDLMLYRLGEKEPKPVQKGVFGYDFTADRLLLRTACIREGRACELYGLELNSPDATPKKLLDGVYSFRTPPGAARVLATYARTDSPLYDAMALNLSSGQYRTLDTMVQLPVLFADKDGSRVAYIVGDRKRAGVYVAEQVP